MPTFPRYEGSVNVATSETPLGPTEKDTTNIRLAQAVQTTAQQGMAIAQRVKDLDDDTKVAERRMQMIREAEEYQQTLVGENAEGAKAKYNEFLAKRRPEWYKGLSKEAAAKLETSSFGRMFEYESNAHKIENRHKIGQAGAAALDMEKDYNVRINQGKILGDPTQSQEFKDLEKYYRDNAARGLWTQEEATKQINRVKEVGYYAAGYRLMVEAPEMYKQEYDKMRGGEDNWLKQIPAQEAARLRSMADERIRSKDQDIWNAENQAYTRKQRREQELREQEEIKVEKRLMGDGPPMTVQDLDMLGGIGGLRLFGGEKYRFYRHAIQENLISGGPGNPDAIRDVGLRVATIDSTPSNVRDIRALKSEIMEKTRSKQLPFNSTTLGWLKSLDEKENSDNSPLNQQTSKALAIALKGTDVSGPMQAPKDMQIAVQTEIGQAFERNRISQNPRPPMQILDENLASWQVRVGKPAAVANAEARRAEKLGPKPQPGKPDEALNKKVKELNKEYADTKTSEVRRQEILNQIERLRGLQERQRRLDEMKPEGGKSPESTVPPAAPGGPIPNRARPQ